MNTSQFRRRDIPQARIRRGPIHNKADLVLITGSQYCDEASQNQDQYRHLQDPSMELAIFAG